MQIDSKLKFHLVIMELPAHFQQAKNLKDKFVVC